IERIAGEASGAGNAAFVPVDPSAAGDRAPNAVDHAESEAGEAGRVGALPVTRGDTSGSRRLRLKPVVERDAAYREIGVPPSSAEIVAQVDGGDLAAGRRFAQQRLGGDDVVLQHEGRAARDKRL